MLSRHEEVTFRMSFDWVGRIGANLRESERVKQHSKQCFMAQFL